MDSLGPHDRRCPPLVYLPGLDGTGRLLFGQDRLRQHYDVHCQRYPHDREQSYASLAQEAAVRIRDCAGGQPVIVLAESFGGGVAIELAFRSPELVQRLVLVNTFVHYPVRWLIRAGKLLGRYLPGRPIPASTRRMRERFLFADDLPRDVRNRWWACVSDVPMSALGRRIALIAGLDRREELSDLGVPARVIVATDDRTVPPAAGFLLADRMPRADLIQVTGGHTVLAHPKFDLCKYLHSDYQHSNPQSSAGRPA